MVGETRTKEKKFINKHERQSSNFLDIFGNSNGFTKGASDIKGIPIIADGINHAVPTQKELQMSIRFLTDKKLILQEGKKYKLTKNGMIHYNFASMKTNIILDIWKNLERQIIK